MAQVSGTFEFQNIENDELILEGFERIGIPGDQLTPVYINSARRSIDFILLQWMSKSVNLWTINKSYLPLNEGQNSYGIESSVIDIRSAHLRAFTRVLGGIAQSNTLNTYDGGGGGNVNFAFDGDYSTSCVQNANLGNISYDYGVGKTNRINFLGIRTATNRNYNFVLEYSNDSVNWIELNLNWTYLYSYTTGVTRWADVIYPVNARYYRIRDLANIGVINVSEIYFCNNTIDTAINAVSEDTYESFSNKNIISRPTCYFFDKKLSPKLYLYPSPSNYFQVLRYSFTRSMYDAGKFFNTPDIPAKMYPALVSGLAWRLAVKYKPEVAEGFKMEYDQEFSEASSMDAEHVDITVSYDLSKYDVR